jgi:hypothetical protein
VLVDFLVSDVWLVASLFFGALVLFATAVQGYQRNILNARKVVPICFGLQLIFLWVGALRLVLAALGLVNSLI